MTLVIDIRRKICNICLPVYAGKNQKKSIMNNNSKILVALAAGIAAGAVLGVLFAPEKGADTRKKILDQGKKMSDDVKNKFSKGMEKLNDLKDGLKEKVEEFA